MTVFQTSGFDSFCLFFWYLCWNTEGWHCLLCYFDDVTFHCVHFYLSLMFLIEKWQACFKKDRIGQGISTLISQGLISNPSATISKLYSVKLFNLFWLHFLTVRERNWLIKGVMSVGFVIINNLSYIRDISSLNISFTSDFWILLPYSAKLSHARKI